MKLHVTQENFAKALATVSRIIPARPSLAVLNNVLLKTNSSRFEISATNLELAVVCKTGAKIENEGALTVPGRLLSELVSSVNGDKLQLISSDNNLRIKSDGLDSLINGISAEEFPVIPVVKPNVSFSVAAAKLHQALGEVVIAAATDEARPVLNGVLVNLSQGYLTLASTDSYRLAETKLALKNDQEFSVIIPVRTITELIRLLGNSSGNVTLALSDNEAVITCGDVSLVSRLIEGKYPDYGQIFPTESASTVTLEREELIRTIKIAALFARESANTIKLSTSKSKLDIMSQASEIGENNSSLDAKVKGDPISIQLNARYLLDSLNVIEANTITLGFMGELNPCLITPALSAKQADSKLRPSPAHIIMPLRS